MSNVLNLSEANCRVLSIQSHVVSGYVGNKCAIFPLRLHGFEVDFVNSVQFSNHTAYEHFTGQVLHSNELVELMKGLHLNGLDSYTHVLTGYMADESFLKSVADTIKDLRRMSPGLFYVCDPVLGDSGQYYVKQSLMPLYRDLLLPMADILTPNLFELSKLTGVKIHNEDSCLRTIRMLHDSGMRRIVVTSTDLSTDPDVLWGYGSEIYHEGQICFRFEIQKLPATFLGTGDVFTVLLLIWFQKLKGDLKGAVRHTVSTIQDLLNFTYEDAKNRTLDGKTPGPKELELKLVRGQKFLVYPQSSVTIVDVIPPDC